MKLFSEYLTESVREYNYTIKLAFKPTSEDLAKIKKALEKYQIVGDISVPKSKPIQRVDKDFPGIDNPEVYTCEVSLSYPASQDMIRHTIASLGMEMQKVVVSSTLHDATVDAEENYIDTNDEGGVALLDRKDPDQDNATISDDFYGDAYNEKLVKNSIGSTSQLIPKELKKEKAKTTNDLPTGKESAMGSKKPNLPKVKSFAR